MEAMIDEIVDPADLKKFEQMYNEQMLRGNVSPKAEFEYAWCLVRSKSDSQVKRGISILEGLFRGAHDETAKRDYLYYLAIGNTRIKEYDKALKYVKAIQHVEPRNHQAAELEQIIKKRMEKDGLIGLAVAGGAAAAVIGGLIGLGFALSKK